MLKKLFLFATITLFSFHAKSATWYAFSDIYGKDAHYYFDADSFSKNGDIIEIWMAIIRNYPIDGSYSAKNKQSMNCKEKSTKITTIITYDKDKNPIRTFSNKNTDFEYLAPGSVGDEILKVICHKDFLSKKFDPNSKKYFIAPDNDIQNLSTTLFNLDKKEAEKRKIEQQANEAQKIIAQKQLKVEVESSLKAIFLRAKNEGVDYNDPKIAAMFDRYANFFAANPDFTGKTVREIHEEAHRNVLLRLGKMPVIANSSGRDLFKEAGIDPKAPEPQGRDVFKELGIDPNSVKPQGRDLFEELGIDPKAPMPKEKLSTK